MITLKVVVAIQGVSLLVVTGSLILCLMRNWRSISSLQDRMNSMSARIDRIDGRRGGGQ